MDSMPASGMAKRRAVIVDDVAWARDNIRTVLELKPDLGVEIVGEADSGEAALRLIPEVHPDIVFMDIGLPDICGLEVARRILLARPGLAVVVVTGHDEPAYRAEAASVGAAGYAVKDDLWRTLPEIVGRALPAA